MIRQQIDQNWEIHEMRDKNWYPAHVPGTVYGDLLENHLMDDPYWRDNEEKALALMDKDYEYKTSFCITPDFEQCDMIILHFDGIDTIADIYLNGILLGQTENMHRIWEYNVSQIVKKEKNELRVILHSPTKFIRKAYEACESDGAPEAMKGFPHLRKAHCMFGWDWGARLPDAGIFRTVALHGIRSNAIDSVQLHQIHEISQVTLMLETFTKKKLEGTSYQVHLITPDGKEHIYLDSPRQIIIKEPQLWWPNGYGDQPLYTMKVNLFYNNNLIDTWERKIGLRTISVSREKDQFGESFAHIVNGVKIFAMGSDYIPEDHLLSRTNKNRTRTLLTDARDCHFNVIRVWGGGYYPEDYFYDICDELGLLVWQDFMFACAVYELSEDFEANIIEEFKDNIIRIRHHASLALWCGNNEMEMFIEQGNEWVKRAKQKTDYINLYEYILPKILKRYDPDTFYWPASPSSGGGFDHPNDETRGDVHYWDVWHGNAPFTDYRNYYFRYVSEFGFQSFPALKTIESFTLPADRNIFSYVMEKHQRNDAANGKIMNYLSQTYLYPTAFDTLLYASQMLQAEAIRYGAEHFRRNRGRCMGTVFWQLNDCWPAASWSSIDYYGRWKALQYYAKRFFAPVLLSCEEHGMLSHCRNINAEQKEIPKSVILSVTNESQEQREVMIRWSLRKNDSFIIQEGEFTIKVEPLCVFSANPLNFPYADIFEDYFAYELWENGSLVSFATELFSIPKYFHFKNPGLKAKINGETIIIEAGAYAKGVEILNKEEDLVLSDNYFDMNAGQKVVKIIRGKPEGLKLRSIYDIR